MTLDDRGVPVPLCPECGAPLGLAVAGAAADCPACTVHEAQAIDAGFLDNYARFGARAHQVVAEACLRSLVVADVADRKLLAITIYEQFVAAAADFIGLAAALKNRHAVPIVRGVLGFRLDTSQAVAFFDDLLAEGPTGMLARLGLPHAEQLHGRTPFLEKRERAQVRDALNEALVDLERLGGFRVLGEQALEGAARGLLGARALADRTDWLAERRLEPGQVAALALDAAGRRVEVSYLSTDEAALGAVVDGIDTLTRLTRNIVFAYVSLHDPAMERSGRSRRG